MASAHASEEEEEDLWDDSGMQYLTYLNLHLDDRQPRWGLPIIRCTYASQQRWDEFLAQIFAMMHKMYFQYDHKDSFTSKFFCPIIEDISRLDGATIAQARQRFDKDMAANPLPPIEYKSWQRQPQTDEERLAKEIERSPYWNFCIYVDEAALTSALDSKLARNPVFNLGGDDWFFYLVPSTRNWETSQVYDAVGRRYEEEGFDEFKKVRASQLPLDYATILDPRFVFNSLKDWKRIGVCEAP